ncbi:uncharacterized protein CHSO_3993 [Chryseobacterium sp. StRB126]|uniref:hypothetical protein n=1 Tax=Chryseobacterium sp. StRB126 TaxID=878220 RepID=UPI0004E9834E|nr:hypothetical protein [Chryseobacterium sp. StRB126]BAP33030.1 uncharacterized protein CHSO_3993 [Chryseobacterium sp. StRB126]
MNKEFGSDFHFIYSEKKQSQFLSQSNLTLFFSGRVAIYNLLKFGISKYGWKKVGFPSYYCHEVVTFCKDLDAEITLYEYNPLEDHEIIWEDNPGSVIVNVNFFGIKKANLDFLKNTVTIEDITHDLLSSNQSSADYYFGSLRKQIPIGAGGFCILKEGESFSDDLQVTQTAVQTYQKKLTAMFLKTEYLEGKLEHNDLYRKYYQEAEHIFEDHATDSLLPDQAIAQLQTYSIENLIAATNENIILGVETLLRSEQFKVANKNNGFCLILYCENQEIRDQLREYLIKNKIFPAVLWPDQIFERDKNLQNRILCVHMDFRYSSEEIKHIANKINSFFENV